MSKQTKMMIVALSCLGVILLYNAWFFWNKGKKSRVPPRIPRLEKTVSAADRPDRKFTPTYISPDPIHDSWGREPFLLPIEIEKGVPYTHIKVDKAVVIDEHPDNLELLEAYRLSGILYDSKQPMAIINERICRVGTRLDSQFTVAEIRRDHLIIRDAHQTFRMTLRGAEAEVPVGAAASQEAATESQEAATEASIAPPARNPGPGVRGFNNVPRLRRPGADQIKRPGSNLRSRRATDEHDDIEDDD